MNRNHVVSVAFIFVLTLASFSFHSMSVSGVASIQFRVEQVAWGTATTNPVEVAPGDTNAPLTVDVRNLSNETLKGIYGTLRLNSSGPFTDYVGGGYNATATGVPLEAGDIFNQTGEISAAGSFSLTFRLNVARGATTGYYRYDAFVEYLVKAGNNTWLRGEPQAFAVTILLPNRPPTIDSFEPSAAPLTINTGDSLNFTAKCSDPDNDTLTREWELDGSLVSNSTRYTYAPTEIDSGTHTLTLTISDGRLTDAQMWTITVAAVSISHVLVSSNYITAGLDNPLNMTLQNNLWKGTVQLRLAVTAPLVLRGNQSWVFNSVEPSTALSVTPRIYAPASSIGQTFTGALTIEYGDEHGQPYTDTYNVGFVVQGYIDLVVYDLVVSPRPVSNVTEVTITATVLNIGNTVASFANVSIVANAVLDLIGGSTSYVGEIERNSPVPFTVVAQTKASVQNGTYPLIVNLFYQDDQYRQHVLNVTADVVVATGTQAQQNSEGLGDMLWFLNNGGWTVLVVAAAGVVLLVLYLRHLSRTKKENKPA